MVEEIVNKEPRIAKKLCNTARNMRPRRCSYPACKNFHDDQYYDHKFPKDEHLRKLWARFIQEYWPLWKRHEQSKSIYLCFNHFTKEDYHPKLNWETGIEEITNTRKLKKGVVPTIHRPFGQLGSEKILAPSSEIESEAVPVLPVLDVEASSSSSCEPDAKKTRFSLFLAPIFGSSATARKQANSSLDTLTISTLPSTSFTPASQQNSVCKDSDPEMISPAKKQAGSMSSADTLTVGAVPNLSSSSSQENFPSLHSAEYSHLSEVTPGSLSSPIPASRPAPRSSPRVDKIFIAPTSKAKDNPRNYPTGEASNCFMRTSPVTLSRMPDSTVYIKKLVDCQTQTMIDSAYMDRLLSMAMAFESSGGLLCNVKTEISMESGVSASNLHPAFDFGESLELSVNSRTFGVENTTYKPDLHFSAQTSDGSDSFKLDENKLLVSDPLDVNGLMDIREGSFSPFTSRDGTVLRISPEMDVVVKEEISDVTDFEYASADG